MSVVHTTDVEGNQCWRLDDKYHRVDGPAVIYANGTQSWYINGKLHREDGPAIIYANGERRWYINGKLHRESGPAIICANGVQYWYKNGKHHCDGGPAIIWVNGDQEWYINGEHRRELHNGEQMPVVLEKNRASFDGKIFFSISADEYEKYRYHPPGRHTKAALREN